MKIRLARRAATLVGAMGLCTAIVLGGPAVAASAAPASPPTPVASLHQPGSTPPPSASGCNGDVCIYVNGSGLHVNYVDSYVYPTNFVCSYATLYVNNSPYEYSNTICISGQNGQSGEAYFNLNRNFANGTVICTTWYNIPGRPCETVLG